MLSQFTEYREQLHFRTLLSCHSFTASQRQQKQIHPLNHFQYLKLFVDVHLFYLICLHVATNPKSISIKFKNNHKNILQVTGLKKNFHEKTVKSEPLKIIHNSIWFENVGLAEVVKQKAWHNNDARSTDLVANFSIVFLCFWASALKSTHRLA